MKLDTKEASEIKEHREDQEGENDSDQFIIRRVDLIVSPPQQYPFAIVSWTGSKVHVHVQPTLSNTYIHVFG